MGGALRGGVGLVGTVRLDGCVYLGGTVRLPFSGVEVRRGGAAAAIMRKTVAARREKVYNGRERSREGFL